MRRPDFNLLDRASAMAWYALQITPQKELVGQEIMRRQGFMTYVPVEYRWRKKNRYTRDKQKRVFPLLPRYLFIGFDPDQVSFFAPFLRPESRAYQKGDEAVTERRIFNVFALPIVTGCVGVADEPRQLVTDQVVKFVNRYPDGLQRPKEEKYMRTGKEFKTGDMVRVAEGPMRDFVVPVVSINAKTGRGKILATMLGMQTELDIALTDLEGL